MLWKWRMDQGKAAVDNAVGKRIQRACNLQKFKYIYIFYLEGTERSLSWGAQTYSLEKCDETNVQIHQLSVQPTCELRKFDKCHDE